MPAAVPPRPALRVPRPERAPQQAPRASSIPPAPLAPHPPAPRAAAKSEPRLSLHSGDLEETVVKPQGDDDPLVVVMAGLRGLTCRRAVEAASVCLAVTVRAVGCRAAMAHLWDVNEKSFVITYALGPNAAILLNAQHGANDPVLAEGFEKRAPRVINHESRPALPRHSAVGGAWSVLVAPAMDGARLLGAFELIDPLDGSCFDDRHVAATRYAAERLVGFLREADSRIGKLIAPPEEA